MLLKFRIWFYFFRRDIKRFFLLKRVLRFGKSLSGIQIYNKEISYLKENGLVIFPYPFEKKYRMREVEIEICEGFPIVDFDGKKMFFQRGYSNNHVKY